jgi:hypothetical protein
MQQLNTNKESRKGGEDGVKYLYAGCGLRQAREGGGTYYCIHLCVSTAEFNSGLIIGQKPEVSVCSNISVSSRIVCHYSSDRAAPGGAIIPYWSVKRPQASPKANQKVGWGALG